MGSDSRDDRGRFRPGVSGNPGGRPLAAQALTRALRAEFAAMGDDELRALVRAWIENSKRAGAAGASFARLLWERLEGSLPLSIDSGPREIRYTFPHRLRREQHEGEGALVISDVAEHTRPFPVQDERLLAALRGRSREE